jgi:prepilin-type processing-associated H-X9-DG protein
MPHANRYGSNDLTPNLSATWQLEQLSPPAANSLWHDGHVAPYSRTYASNHRSMATIPYKTQKKCTASKTAAPPITAASAHCIGRLTRTKRLRKLKARKGNGILPIK